MFGNLKAMGALAGLMQDKQKLTDAAERLKNEAEAMRAPGESGGGAVRVIADGKMRILEVTVSPAAAGAVADETSRAQVEQMIAEATNAALAEAQRRMRLVVEREARELGLEDMLDKLPAGFGGLPGLPGA
ncbi:MAG: YbaB/EbfC family nucleoid-associated protein [Planctomycetota bacterium]